MTDSSIDLRNRVGKWLAKQGYPFELRVGNVFRSAGWDISHSTFYEDPETHKQREIDMYAQVQSGTLYGIQVVLAIECKSSPEKPWVAFSSSRSIDPPLVELMHVPWGAGQELIEKWQQDGALPPAFKVPVLLAHGITTAFVDKPEDLEGAQRSDKSEKPQKPTTGQNLAYAAVMGAAKAAAARASLNNKRVLAGWPTTIEIVLAVVILDGHLFEFFLAEDGTEQLQEVEQAKLFLTDSSVGTDAIVVTVVTEKGLLMLVQQMKTAASTVFQKMPDSPELAAVVDSFQGKYAKKPAPVVTLRKEQFQKEIAKLKRTQLMILKHVVACGERDASQVLNYLQDQGIRGHEIQIDNLLWEITQKTGFLERLYKAHDQGFARYSVNPIWEDLLAELFLEWAPEEQQSEAPPF